VTELPDGRLEFRIKHELLRGVTSEMIIWFLNNMTDLVEYEGEKVQRYLFWHPRDHISLNYLKPAEDGRNFAHGAQLQIREAFQGNALETISIRAVVEFLDATGFAHHERMFGLKVARMEYTFTPRPNGLRYENKLVVGLEGGTFFSRMFNRNLLPRMFPKSKGIAWIRHNVEEVGCFESFLPQMYAQDGP